MLWTLNAVWSMSATGWYFFVLEKVPMTFERREEVQVTITKFQNFIFTLVFVFAYFVASPIAKKLAFRIANPERDNKMFIILSIQTFTVMIMVGLMSIYGSFVQQLINNNIICNYIILYFKNFIMAYLLQIFFIGPLVRNIFRIIFKKQLQQA